MSYVILSISFNSIGSALVLAAFLFSSSRTSFSVLVVLIRVPSLHSIDHFGIVSVFFLHCKSLILRLRKPVPFAIKIIISHLSSLTCNWGIQSTDA